MKIGGHASLGSRKAPLALVAFSDCQCPFCRRFQDTAWNLIKEKYVDKGKLLLVFHDLPLDIHGQARGAAIGARCAGRQNAYWGMHQLLFDQQRRLGPSVFASLATELKLDAAAFDACSRDPQTGKAVDVAVAEALRLGIQQTPYGPAATSTLWPTPPAAAAGPTGSSA